MLGEHQHDNLGVVDGRQRFRRVEGFREQTSRGAIQHLIPCFSRLDDGIGNGPVLGGVADEDIMRLRALMRRVCLDRLNSFPRLGANPPPSLPQSVLDPGSRMRRKRGSGKPGVLFASTRIVGPNNDGHYSGAPMPREPSRMAARSGEAQQVFDYGFCGEGDVGPVGAAGSDASRNLVDGAALSVADSSHVRAYAVHSSLTDHGAMMAT